MRIIGGERRGHRLAGPEARHTRPTSDLVREAIFNILADEPAGRPAFDLFAGTGAMGLEALSRGARDCLFVERDRDNAAVIRRNLGALRYEDRARITQADAFRILKRLPDRLEPGPPPLVFLDPPYAEYRNHPDRLRGALEAAVVALPDGTIFVVEGPEGITAEILPSPSAWDLRSYASTVVALRFLGETADESPDEDLDSFDRLDRKAGSDDEEGTSS